MWYTKPEDRSAIQSGLGVRRALATKGHYGVSF